MTANSRLQIFCIVTACTLIGFAFGYYEASVLQPLTPDLASLGPFVECRAVDGKHKGLLIDTKKRE